MAKSALGLSKFLVKPPEETLVVDSHCFEVTHLELLAVTTELGSQTVALGLQLFLADVERLQVLELLLDLDNFFVLVLVIFDELVDCDFFLHDHGLALVTLSFAFTAVTLIFKRHINHIFFVRQTVLAARVSELSRVALFVGRVGLVDFALRVNGQLVALHTQL